MSEPEKMNQEPPCAAAQDLMPLYVENLTSPETSAWLQAHVSHCPACAQKLGQQQARLEIGRPEQERLREQKGVRFLKKPRVKRIAYILLALVLALALVAGGNSFLYRQLFSVQSDEVELVGRYQLDEDHVVLALKVKGLSVNQLRTNRFLYQRTCQFQNDSSCLKRQYELWLSLEYTRADRWFGRADERGDVLYYVIDTRNPINNNTGTSNYNTCGFHVEALEDQAEWDALKDNELTVYMNGSKALWWPECEDVGLLTDAEKQALLQAMNKAGGIGHSGRYAAVDAAKAPIPFITASPTPTFLPAHPTPAPEQSSLTATETPLPAE